MSDATNEFPYTSTYIGEYIEKIGGQTVTSKVWEIEPIEPLKDGSEGAQANQRQALERGS